jgi:hypothetical protein
MLSLEKFFTVGFDRWRLKRVSGSPWRQWSHAILADSTSA